MAKVEVVGMQLAAFERSMCSKICWVSLCHSYEL